MRTWLGLVLLIALIGAACGRGGDSDADQTATPGGLSGSRGSDSTEGDAPIELDCDRGGYPCAWDEVDPAAVVRTDQLLAFSSLLLTEGASAEEIATRLEGAAGVAEVAYDPITVRFRVDGAVPVFVYVDPTEGGLIESSIPTLDMSPRGHSASPAQGATFSGCSAGEDRADGERGPVGKTGEPKKALILGPWKWQMTWDVDTLESLLKLGKSDYEQPGGSVDIVMSRTDLPSAFGSGNDAVRLEHFCGWEGYDTVILKTHGRTICDGGNCHTSLSVGRFQESEADLRAYAGGATGVTFGTSSYGNLESSLSPAEVKTCIARLEIAGQDDVSDPTVADDCLEKLPTGGHMEVTTDFFRANYSGGLKDRMLFFSACQGMKEGDLASALRGTGDSSGVILGFDKIIQTSVSNRVLEQFAEWVGTGRAIDKKALAQLNDLVDDYGAQANVAGQIEGEFSLEELADLVPDGSEVTRGADIVSLHPKFRGPELEDGGTVKIDGMPGDDEDDKLKLAARLTGVSEEGPDAYPIELRLDGRKLNLEDYDWKRGEPDGTFDVELVAEVGGDLVPGMPVDLEIRTVLPNAGGAISRWEYEQIKIGSPGAVISVGGQTWEFQLDEFFGGCAASSNNVIVAGAVDGDYQLASFSGDLRVEGGELTVTDPAGEQSWMAASDRAGMTVFHLVPEGDSQIDDITFDGNTISGGATFIDTDAFRAAWSNKEPYPGGVEGTFEITCTESVDGVGP